MRALALVLALVTFTPLAYAQRPPVRPHLSLAGGAGSGGAAARLGLALERGAYAATLRLTADGLGGGATSPDVRQRTVEFGVLGTWTVDVAKRISLRGGGGLAYGITSIDEPGVDEFFLEGSAYTLALPVEAEVQLHANDFVALTLGVYRSFVLGRISGGGAADTADLGHGGVVVGLRMRR